MSMSTYIQLNTLNPFVHKNKIWQMQIYSSTVSKKKKKKITLQLITFQLIKSHMD